MVGNKKYVSDQHTLAEQVGKYTSFQIVELTRGAVVKSIALLKKISGQSIKVSLGLSNISNQENITYFPIRLGQKICTILNGQYFFITVKTNEKNYSIPQYFCECNNVTDISSSSSTAISNVYKKLFKKTTRYSGPLGLSNISNQENITYFPIRLGQKICTILNGQYFFITVKTNEKNYSIPQYFCECNNVTDISSSSSTAISNVYKKLFKKTTRYSGPLVMGWNNKEIIQKLYKGVEWIPFSISVDIYEIFVYSIGTSSNSLLLHGGNNYKASLVHFYERRQAIFVSKIEKKNCKIKIYQDSLLAKVFVGTTPDEVWEKSGFIQKFKRRELFGLENKKTQEILYNYRVPSCLIHEWDNIDLMEKIFVYHLKRRTIASINYKDFLFTWEKNGTIIEIYSELKKYYPINYEFNEREWYAWRSFLQAIGCVDITPWSKEESKFQLWTRASDSTNDKATLENLYKLEFLVEIPVRVSNATQIFWSCFNNALTQNKKIHDGKRRILSIIAENFTYSQLQENLKVGTHLISEARKHARLNGCGMPPLSKPIITRLKFTSEKLEQFEKFFMDRDIVNMSSYKSDNKSGLPILYLQDQKQMLWERFHECYPNGIRRTAFMTRLQGSRYVYKDNLGGLCSECNECGYEVFGEITVLIKANINEEVICKELLDNSQTLRRYIRRDFSKQFQISTIGEAQHDSCITHCLRYAFGSCNLSHPDTCSNCELLFTFFNKMKKNLSLEFHEQLDNYQKKIIKWMGHHARKTYLNKQVKVNLDELDNDDAVLIVNYKMKIVPQTVREIKKDWYGKRGWALHTVLIYTKDININRINVQAFDHWSDDTHNGSHYHCTELMIILGHWYEWYNIIPRKWIFLEAGEAKTSIDSHHAQISQAMKRYIRLGSNIESGDDIEEAIKNIAGTHVANLMPSRSNEKNILETIHGIRVLQEWSWPTDGENVGFILGRSLPGIGDWKKWSPVQIEKISKNKIFEKPDPICSTHTQSTKSWTVPIITLSKNIDVEENKNIENIQEFLDTNISMDIGEDSISHFEFTYGWALKENQKNKQCEPIKRINDRVKNLLETMFHTGTANPRQKLSAEQMYTELLEQVHQGEMIEEKLPKVSTIANWISAFSRKWKTAMAVRSLEETENLNLPNSY
ncbi:hypothetical protein Glove_184g100 [Diversispora epigaea]|uniref:Uncharacterized protein n=1 Tax=Diversispora epigaea TaxID=1348612 RepID=A0A397IQG9_9GLOM|nr:hypothetical protein Glove_184g100 [Diversispora epigaea]